MTEQAIIYIGVNDHHLELFEGQYSVPEGISYNSYLIKDEKIAIMDTVDKRKVSEFMNLLILHLSGRTPDYLVISHMEPDHASGICHLLEAYPDICLVGNQKTFKLLSLYLETQPRNILLVKEGDLLSLGKHRLKFYMAPMVHWPEVMVTYEETTQTLFSADAFGKFGVIERNDFPYLAAPVSWLYEARRYYFNIVGKYGAPVQALLKKLSTLPLKRIAPLHGPILPSPLDFYLSKYHLWSRYLPETEGVMIAYTSFHGNTAAAAYLLKDCIQKTGYNSVILTDLSKEDMSKAVEYAFRYSKLVLAAPSYDGGLMPFMEDFLQHLKSKNFQNREIALIENTSWAPCAGKRMTELLSDMSNIHFLAPTITIQGKLKENDIQNLIALAALLSEGN